MTVGAESPRCCLVRLQEEGDFGKLVQDFSGRAWIRNVRGRDEEMQERCCISATPPLRADVRTTMNATGAFLSKSGESHTQDNESAYMSRKQKREARKLVSARQKDHDEGGKTDNGMLRELYPPRGLPRGNVGTPTTEMRALAGRCLIPPSALRSLGVALSSDLRVRRRGEYSYAWGAVGDEEGAEEWERHEEAHGPVPEHGWERTDRLECENHLFEDKCEQVWEKGSSGLVLYTDDAHWDAQMPDFDERTYDGLDVADDDPEVACDWDAGAPLAEQIHSTALAALPDPRRKRPRTPPLLRNAAPRVPTALRDAFRRRLLPPPSPRQRVASPPALLGPGGAPATSAARCADAFERDCGGGLPGRLMAEMGWREGEPLGTGVREQGLAQQLAVGWRQALPDDVRERTLQDRWGAAASHARARRRGIGFQRSKSGSDPGDSSGDDAGDESCAPELRAALGQAGSLGVKARPLVERVGPGRGNWRGGDGKGGWGWVSLGLGGGVMLEDGHRLIGSKFDPLASGAGPRPWGVDRRERIGEFALADHCEPPANFSTMGGFRRTGIQPEPGNDVECVEEKPEHNVSRKPWWENDDSAAQDQSHKARDWATVSAAGARALRGGIFRPGGLLGGRALPESKGGSAIATLQCTRVREPGFDRLGRDGVDWRSVYTFQGS